MMHKKLKVLKYKEGYSYPIENNILIDSESNYNQSLLERDIDKLWTTKKDYSDLTKYIIIGAVFLVVIFILANLFKGGGTT